MKRIVVLLLTLCMVFVLAACGTQSDETVSDSQADTSAAVSEDSSASENDEQSDEDKQTAAANFNDNTPDSTAEENNNTPANTDSSVLVVYFSCTGKTVQNLAASCPGAALREGRLLNGNISSDALKKWVETL